MPCVHLLDLYFLSRLALHVRNVEVPLDETPIERSSVSNSSQPSGCYGNDTIESTCLDVCVEDVYDTETMSFELSRAHYVTGFKLYLINASDDVIEYWKRNMSSLAVEYEITSGDGYVNTTAWVGSTVPALDMLSSCPFY